MDLEDGGTDSRYSHIYQKLPLIPVEEFLAQHPEHADDDENALMEARIDHEKAEREALEQQRQELLKRKQKLIADNKKRRDDLANLDKDLEKFIDVRLVSKVTLNGISLILERPRNPSRNYSRKSFEVKNNMVLIIYNLPKDNRERQFVVIAGPDLNSSWPRVSGSDAIVMPGDGFEARASWEVSCAWG